MKMKSCKRFCNLTLMNNSISLAAYNLNVYLNSYIRVILILIVLFDTITM